MSLVFVAVERRVFLDILVISAQNISAKNASVHPFSQRFSRIVKNIPFFHKNDILATLNDVSAAHCPS